ncbi:MAG: sugar ABC transporter ATP-binding protein [Phycisphaeraceae bacterium]
MSGAIITVTGLSKDFGPVRALERIDLSFHVGQVHGLIGENGAGKSTFMRILAGLETPTAGQLHHRGNLVQLRRPADAMALGVAMIHQELNLVDELSVADNIFLGRERTRRGLVDLRRTFAEAHTLLASLNCSIDPSTKVKHLSIGQQQMVEIARALATDTTLLIMDEPTAALSVPEARALFDLIARLKSRGVTIIYISHILPEVMAVCDCVTVLRDGRVVSTLRRDEIPTGHAGEAKLASLMVGRPLGDHFPRGRPRMSGAVPALEVHNLSLPNILHDITFALHRGEILGFAGLIGAGRTELAETIVGLRRRAAGSIIIDGRQIAIRHLRDAVCHGIAYLSEDRKGRGLTLGMDIVANTTLVSLRRYCHPLINRREEEQATMHHVQVLRTRIGRLRDPIDTLSGGNQQKVALAKWLEVQPRILILDEPTRGVDIGAKEEIYRLIHTLALEGMACLLISSELNEVLGLSTRIAVMRRGRLVRILQGDEATEEQVMYHAAGVRGEPV